MTRAFAFAISIATIACAKTAPQELDAGSDGGSDAVAALLACTDVGDGCQCDVNGAGSPTQACSVISVLPDGDGTMCCAALNGSAITSCECVPFGCYEFVEPADNTTCTCAAKLPNVVDGAPIDTCTTNNGVCCLNSSEETCTCHDQQTRCDVSETQVLSCSLSMLTLTCKPFAPFAAKEQVPVTDCRALQ